MKILGITGGVGAGKSTVLAYLEERYQAKVIQLDLVGHELMAPSGAAYAPIVETFGGDIVDETGIISRPALYQKAFADRRQVERLNKIVHPLVKEEILRRIALARTENRVPFVVLEAALLLDDGYETICDEIWYIYVDDKTRASRLKLSRGYTQEKVTGILSNQKTDEEFRRSCQFVVDNSGDLMENTYGQIDKGLREHGFV